jgi:hypothetical protein
MAGTRGRWAAVAIALVVLAAAAATAVVLLIPDRDAEVQSVTWSTDEVDLGDPRDLEYESVVVGITALSEDNAVSEVRLESARGEVAALTDVRRGDGGEGGLSEWEAALSLPEDTAPGRWSVVGVALEKRQLSDLVVPDGLDDGVTFFVGTALSIEGPSTVPVGTRAQITGTLTRTDGITPVPDSVVILDQLDAASWPPVEEASTDENGVAAFEVRVDAPGASFRLRHIGGEDIRGSVSSELSVTTRKVTRSLSLKYNEDSTAALGELSPSEGGVEVQVQQAPSLTSNFQTIGTVRTDTDGRFTFPLNANAEYRAYVPETAGGTAATSNQLSVGD